MTISIYDLEILTEAMVFAVLVTMGGVISWALGRELSRRHGPRRDVRVALAGAALIAVGAAGVTVRSTVGDAVPVVARVASAPLEERAETRPALRLDEPRSSSDDATTSRLEGTIQTGDAMRSEPASGSAGTAGPADDPGTNPGSDGVPNPPPVDVEPSDDPPDEEPSDDPPQTPPDDPPDEEPSDDPSPTPDDEGPSGQGPDGQGPPGQDGGGPPGQGPDGDGPPGQGGTS